MAAPDTSVKYFHSGMSGAPQLSGTAGALIAILDACLVNGFGIITLDSLVVAGGIATATRSAGQSFEKDAVVLVAGSTPAGLNGDKRILSISGTQFTFDATGVADGAASGTITAKLAPAGWEKLFAGTNLGAYRSLDIAASDAVLRVDDSGAQVARVVGYESMSDVSTGTNPFPTAGQQSGGLYWSKSSTASSATRDWILVADSRFLIFLPATYASTQSAFNAYAFGDALSWKPADAYPAVIMGETGSNAGTSAPGIAYGSVFYTAIQGVYLQRDAAGLAASQPGSNKFPGWSATAIPSGDASFSSYPSAIHGSLIANRMILGETASSTADNRHTVPGAVFLCSSIPSGVFSSKTKFIAEGELAGRTLYAIEFSSGGSRRAMIDISGPWR